MPHGRDADRSQARGLEARAGELWRAARLGVQGCFFFGGGCFMAVSYVFFFVIFHGFSMVFRLFHASVGRKPGIKDMKLFFCLSEGPKVFVQCFIKIPISKFILNSSSSV